MEKNGNPSPEELPEERKSGDEEIPEEGGLDFYIRTIEELCRERDEYHDLLQRKQAEFENFKKRVRKERTQDRLKAYSEVAKELLPVLDACEKGLESLIQKTSAPMLKAYDEGYRLLVQQLKTVLERFDVQAVPALGELFDPNLHEAVLREISGVHSDGEILDEYRKGYRIRDHLLRAAQVKVAVRPEATAPSDDTDGEDEN